MDAPAGILDFVGILYSNTPDKIYVIAAVAEALAHEGHWVRILPVNNSAGVQATLYHFLVDLKIDNMFVLQQGYIKYG
jgi:hypothetical protein